MDKTKPGVRRRGGASGPPRPECQPAHRPGFAVFLHSRAGEVSAHDAFDGKHDQASGDHGPSDHFRRDVGRQDVIGGDVGQLFKPPQGQLGEYLAFVRDLGRQHEIVCADAVGSDDEVGVGSAMSAHPRRNVYVAYFS